MAQGAKVDSIDAVRSFRAAMIKFAETGNVAMTSADSDIDRVLGWLERDQTVYWNAQLRKRHDEVMKCEDAVRQKRIFKAVDGTAQSAVDEMKALGVAKRRKEEAEQKCIVVKKAIGVLRKEAQLYRGRVQRFATTLQSDIPNAVRSIDGMLANLDAYLAVQTAGVGIGLAEAAENIAKAPPSPKVGTERLRDRTPTAEQRETAPPQAPAAEDSLFQPWAAGAMQDWQREALAQLSIPRLPIDPDQKVVVLRDCWKQPRIYIERREPAFDGDSGWCLSSVDPVENEILQYDALRVGDVVAGHADLKDLFTLPIGFLVVLDPDGLTAMLDGAGLDVWAVALVAGEEAASEKPAEETEAAPENPPAEIQQR